MKRNLIFCALTFLILSAGCGSHGTAKVESDHTRNQVTMSDPDGKMAPKPPVMLGVNMAPGGPIMSKHLGIDGDSVTMIIAVGEDTPASDAGLEIWDVIVGVHGSDQASPSSLRRILRASRPGDVIPLEVRRGPQTITIEVVVEEADHGRMIPLPAGTEGT